MRVTSSSKLVIGSAVLIAAIAGCAAPKNDAAPSTAAPNKSVNALGRDAEAAAKLPAAVAAAGKVTVASGVTFPPMEYYAADNKTVLGFDADLGKALGEVLGITFQFQNVDFDGIIGGLNAGRYDLTLTGMLDKKSREFQVDFVDYLNSGVAIMVAKGNPSGIASKNDLCGRKVAVEKGATGDLTADDITAACTKAGKSGVAKEPFPDQASAVQALSSGRADAVLALDLTLAYTIKQDSGRFQLAGDPFDALPIGVALPKKSTQLRDAVQAALLKVQSSGVYDQLLAKWNLTKQGLLGAPINAGSKS